MINRSSVDADKMCLRKESKPVIMTSVVTTIIGPESRKYSPFHLSLYYSFLYFLRKGVFTVEGVKK